MIAINTLMLLASTLITTPLAAMKARDGDPTAFTETCSGLRLMWPGEANTVLEGNCSQTGTGAKPCTYVFLDSCYAVDDRGQITPRMWGGGFINKCNDCELTDGSSCLSCNCTNKEGKWAIARTDLTQTVRNDDGYLWCLDVKGNTCPQ
ncbi:uncharacterized protein BCR38DRAFT_406957 [Pseudomassariella vexata]|uniref:Cyanovirin-N domain-containing protein n=1 Tax=Pseudomassariella vexata TaxID=1141098 RepID=A0A1Y2EBY9_9PEZI|nr:uncharacterized protein BCR38DRAFT_406957 [Pseudomassariella vexata]ORY69090.1 hypothetical protein BCR38DRAFT_406957 [Pseudomassariella vexata]